MCCVVAVERNTKRILFRSRTADMLSIISQPGIVAELPKGKNISQRTHEWREVERKITDGKMKTNIDTDAGRDYLNIANENENKQIKSHRWARTATEEVKYFHSFCLFNASVA